jgi:hypothetical protein
MSDLLSDLARAKAVFQLRALAEIINASGIETRSAETENTGSVRKDESPAPKGDAHTQSGNPHAKR